MGDSSRLQTRDVYSTPFNMVYPIIPGAPPRPPRDGGVRATWVGACVYVHMCVRIRGRGCNGRGKRACKRAVRELQVGPPGMGFPRKKFQLHRRPSSFGLHPRGRSFVEAFGEGSSWLSQHRKHIGGASLFASLIAADPQSSCS